jgi:hypothetical protein
MNWIHPRHLKTISVAGTVIPCFVFEVVRVIMPVITTKQSAALSTTKYHQNEPGQIEISFLGTAMDSPRAWHAC